MGFRKTLLLGIVTGLIVEGIVYGISFVVSRFGLSFLFEMQMPFWLVLFSILFTFSSVAFYFRAKSKNGGFIAVIPSRPSYYVVRFKSTMFSVKWNLLYGTSSTIDPVYYAFCDGGPYCPDCMYEMDAEMKGLIPKRYYWKCDRCGKSYKCPANTPYDAERMVEKMLESEIRSGRLKVP